MVKILPYKRGSKSAKALAHKLGAKRIVSDNYRQRMRELVINWGKSRATQALHTALNKPESVYKASNKLLALQAMKSAGVSTPEFTTQQEEAARWLIDESKVVVRHVLNGHSGQGAEVVEPGGTVPAAPLYTKYTRKDAEFRVHVFNGRVIDFCKKRRRQDYQGNTVFSDYIRTHQHGWIFCRNNVTLPECVKTEALKAVAALGLDFGACDVLFREKRSGQVAWVLEVNTAPGLEGTTLEKYSAAFQEYVNARGYNQPRVATRVRSGSSTVRHNRNRLGRR